MKKNKLQKAGINAIIYLVIIINNEIFFSEEKQL